MDSDEGEGDLIIDEDAFTIDESAKSGMGSEPRDSPMRNPLYLNPLFQDDSCSSPATSLNTSLDRSLSEGEIVTPKKNHDNNDDFDIYDDEGFLTPKKLAPTIHVRGTRREVSKLAFEPNRDKQNQEDKTNDWIVKPEPKSPPRESTSAQSPPPSYSNYRDPINTPASPDMSPESPERPPDSQSPQQLTPASPSPPRAPESPSWDSRGRPTFMSRVTRVRVETEGEDRSLGLGFAIDCMGSGDKDERFRSDRDDRVREYDDRSLNSRQEFSQWDQQMRNENESYERGSQRSDFDHRRPRERRPSYGYATRGGRSNFYMERHPREGIDYGDMDEEYESERERREESRRPLYDVENDVMFDGSDVRRSSTGSDMNCKTRDDFRPKSACWNCKGDHVIHECPEKKDPQRINANRKAFMVQKNRSNAGNNINSNGRQQRYHEENTNQKFAKLYNPGTLSLQLRHALGIKQDEVPLHVMRMRVYGYPPGYLESAMEEASSGLKLYGENITIPYGSKRVRDTSINPESIVAYPGYNAPMPAGQADLGREMGYPRYSPEDSIFNMIIKLNEKGSGGVSIPVQKDDGIRSVSSQKDQLSWEVNSNSLRVVDRPLKNDSAKFGIGRGKFMEQTMEHRYSLKTSFDKEQSRELDRNIRKLVHSEELERQREARGKERVRLGKSGTADTRYMPNQPPQKVRRPNRSSSPSLLRDGGSFEPEDGERSTSPTIVNLPPVSPTSNRPVIDTDWENPETPSSPKVEEKTAQERIALNCGGSDTGTGSSADFQLASGSESSSRAKRRFKKTAESDSDVMIIGDSSSSSATADASASDDSVCLISDLSPKKKVPLKKSDRVQAAKSSPAKKPLAKPNKTSVVTVQDDEVVQLDSPANAKGVPSPGSSTGDEDMITQNSASSVAQPAHANAGRPAKGAWGNLEENWEEQSDKTHSDADIADVDTDCDEVEILSEPEKENLESKDCQSSPVMKEFIPVSPHIAAIKDVLLKNASEESETVSSDLAFQELPSFDKFAHGMPEMVFEEDMLQRTGRLDKVLSALKARKSAESSPSK